MYPLNFGFMRNIPAVPTLTRLYGWGNNGTFSIGDGTNTTRASPVLVGSLSNVAQIAASGTTDTNSQFALAITDTGSLFAWGYNALGQLGLGDTTNRTTPVQVVGSWTAVATGEAHTLAIRSNGTMWAWGFNSFGQLGINNDIRQSSPVQVGARSWIAVAAMGESSFAIRDDGTLWAWGLNNDGQLGNGNTTGMSSPVQIGGDQTWKRIFCGYRHAAAIRSDDTLWMWGLNGDGQVGNNSSINVTSPVQIGTTTWTSIAPVYNNTIGIQTNGSLWHWGYDSANIMPVPNASERRSVPVLLDNTATWKNVAASALKPAYIALATKSNGTLFTWGFGSATRPLGDGSTFLRSSPVQIGTKSWSAIGMGFSNGFGSSTE